MERKTHTIDAAGKVWGRLSTEVAVLLRGKNNPNFVPNKDTGGIVIIKNADKIKFTGRKFEDKKYYRHSGYRHGLKEIPLKKVFEASPAEVLKRAVFGMLPKNRLRTQQIKRLKFE